MVSIRTGASVRPLSEIEEEKLERSDRTRKPPETSALVDAPEAEPSAEATFELDDPPAAIMGRPAPSPNASVNRPHARTPVVEPSEDKTPPRAFSAVPPTPPPVVSRPHVPTRASGPPAGMPEPPPTPPPPLPAEALDSHDDLVVDRHPGGPTTLNPPTAPMPEPPLTPGAQLDHDWRTGEALLPGAEVAGGRFTIVGHLGAGGMADVYLAEQTGVAGFKKQVVIKRILPGLVRDKKFVDLFVREAHVASSLTHSNVVQIYELGEDRGTYFIAMEYVRGLTLMDLAEHAWKLREPLPLEVVLLAASDAAQGLHYGWRATGAGGAPMHLVHRDVSPDNLIINTDGTCKVLDFGVAKSQGSQDLTQAGELKGKLSYIPPEMLAGRSWDHRGDLYGLGVTLYAMLTGDVPFNIQNPMELLEKVVRTAAVPPSVHNPEVPPEIDALVLQLLAKEPDRRPQDGDVLSYMLLEMLGSQARRPASGAYVERMLHKSMEVDDIDGIPGGIVHAAPVTDAFAGGKRGRSGFGGKLKKLFGR
jgi:hypothetical protein